MLRICFDKVSMFNQRKEKKRCPDPERKRKRKDELSFGRSFLPTRSVFFFKRKTKLIYRLKKIFELLKEKIQNVFHRQNFCFVFTSNIKSSVGNDRIESIKSNNSNHNELKCSTPKSFVFSTSRDKVEVKRSASIFLGGISICSTSTTLTGVSVRGRFALFCSLEFSLLVVIFDGDCESDDTVRLLRFFVENSDDGDEDESDDCVAVSIVDSLGVGGLADASVVTSSAERTVSFEEKTKDFDSLNFVFQYFTSL